MKIRTQLIVALLLLAVLPLTGIVVYSYVSSERAARQTVEAEAKQLTADMSNRLAAVKDDLERRIRHLGDLSFGDLAGARGMAGDDTERVLVEGWLSRLGDAAHLVESFEVVPVPPPPPQDAPRPPEGAPAPPVAPVPPPELEAILLEVTREVEQLQAGGSDNDGEQSEDQITRFGVEVAVAMVEALGTLPVGTLPVLALPDEPETAEEHDAAHAEHEAGEHQPTHLRRWVDDLERRGEDRHDELREHDEARRRMLAERRKLNKLVIGRTLDFPVREQGAAVGWVKPHLSARDLLEEVLRKTRRDQGEMPYALDAEDRLYVADDADDADRETLDGLLFPASSKASPSLEEWVRVETEDPETGLRFGIARPIGETLAAVDRAARRNLTYGLSLIGLAFGGVLWVSTRMTRNLKTLTDGAERIAAGDLQTRVPVRARDELGQLAAAFNRMAGELSRHREQLLKEERRRRRKEIERKILEADNARKTRELEEARQFQLSLLPKTLPEHPSFALAVHMETATEVGGDYYDFRLSDDGTLVAAVGDATGHGARAGTMVTVIKSLFSATSTEAGLGAFLGDADRAIQRMDLGRMNMALLLAELRREPRRGDAGGYTLTVASAGMPPPLIHRAAKSTVEEISVPGLPLGTFASTYNEQTFELAAGDTVLLMSDGFPELPSSGGEPLGYARARELFAAAVAPGDGQPRLRRPHEIISELTAAAAERTAGGPPSDDVTFVVLRLR